MKSQWENCHSGGGGGGFFLACEDFGRMFNHSLVEIRLRTLIPLFTSGSDHIGKIQCVKLIFFFFLTCLTANKKMCTSRICMHLKSMQQSDREGSNNTLSWCLVIDSSTTKTVSKHQKAISKESESLRRCQTNDQKTNKLPDTRCQLCWL